MPLAILLNENCKLNNDNEGSTTLFLKQLLVLVAVITS